MALRDLILKHFWLKLFSVILAGLIWLAISANLGKEVLSPAAGAKTDALRTFSQCPVLLMTATTDHHAYTVEPSQVSVIVRGPAAVVDQLQEREIHTYVESKTPRDPTGETPVKVHAPQGVIVVHVSPQNVTIKIAE